MLTLIDSQSPASERAAFCRYVRQVFKSVAFDRWIDWGQWTADYRAYAWFEGEQAIANASLHRMHLIVDGEPIDAWQLGAVGVVPAARGRGLARTILRQVLATHGEQPLFLFANPNVLDFYPRFGFAPREETVFRAEIAAQPAAPAPAFDASTSANRDLLCALASAAPVSRRFAAVGHGPIVLWYLANGLVPTPRLLGRDTLIFSEQQGDELYLYEVLSTAPVDLMAVLPHLIEKPIRRVRFGFTPDVIWPKAQACGADPDPYLFVRGLSPPPPHKFPLLAQT